MLLDINGEESGHGVGWEWWYSRRFGRANAVVIPALEYQSGASRT